MIRSMTGYGFAESAGPDHNASIEIKSWNNRFLDLILTLPPSLSPLEERVREKIRSVLVRGRVEVMVRFRDLQENVQVQLDAANVAVYARTLRELARLAGLEGDIRLDHLLQMEGIIRIDRQRDLEAWWSILEPVLDRALEAMQASRLREGQAIHRDLVAQLDRLGQSHQTFTAMAGRMEELVREGLRRRFVEVMGDLVDQDRMLAEVAVQLNRLTINEELVRLGAHLAAARQMLDSGEPVGKKLDFLAQEINREINTIGSKSSQLDLTDAVITAKDALENLREQLRNVE